MVCLVPPASTWSRLRNSTSPGQAPLRSRSQPLGTSGLDLRATRQVRQLGDREDVPIDYRYLDLLLRTAEDPEVGMEEYAQGVRVGPRVRIPRLPALYRQKKRWRIPEQSDPLDYLERPQEEGVTWRRNYSSLDHWKEKALEVWHDQASRGQVLILRSPKPGEGTQT